MMASSVIGYEATKDNVDQSWRAVDMHRPYLAGVIARTVISSIYTAS